MCTLRLPWFDVRNFKHILEAHFTLKTHPVQLKHAPTVGVDRVAHSISSVYHSSFVCEGVLRLSATAQADAAFAR